MKILQISSARSFGGGERHFADLVNGLSARGHQVSVALAPDSPIPACLNAVPSERTHSRSLRFPFSLASLRRVARDDFDVVHAHLARDYPPAALCFARTQLFFTRHVLFPLGRVHRATFARAARVIAVSQPVAEGLRAQRLCPPEKIVCVRNGINLDEFRFAPPPDDSGGKFLVGMLGEISPVKDQETFLRAARAVAGRLPSARFLIAGEDASRDGRHLRRLNEMIRQFDLSARVQLLGKIERAAPYLASLDVFVSASRSESFGLSIAEACASGAAAVATATAGASEIIENDVNGKLVPVGDAAAMADAVSQLLSDGGERRRLARRARSTIEKDFSLTRMVDETERLYEAALRERG